MCGIVEHLVSGFSWVHYKEVSWSIEAYISGKFRWHFFVTKDLSGRLYNITSDIRHLQRNIKDTYEWCLQVENSSLDAHKYKKKYVYEEFEMTKQTENR